MKFSVIEEMKILIRQWKVTSIHGLSGSMIAVISLAVLYEFMGAYHRYLSLPASKRYLTREPSKSKRIRDHILGTLSYLLSVLASYLLMLVVATYDVWLFASIVSGAAFGYFLSNPLYTWYSSIEFRNSETDGQKNNNNNNRPERPAHRISTL